MNIENADIIRTQEETILDKANRDKFKNEFALRYANYISNYTNKKTWTEFITKSTIEEVEEMEEWYMNDFILRPYTKLFKQQIGDITNFDYTNTILVKILKRIAYNDIVHFYEYLGTVKTFKKHIERLGL